MHFIEKGKQMKRGYLLGTAVVVALAGATARADVKDPLPDSLSLGGVTVYGTVDVGYAYQSKGVPLNGDYLGGLEYQAFTTTRNFSGSVSTPAESGLEQSKIGIRVAEPIIGDLQLIARAETAFNPLSGKLTDACNAIAQNSGKPQGEQTANADSSRCGQAFNSMLFGGVASATYGQLTIGRQNSLQLDALAQFDPQALSYAFSFLGYSGFDAGAGSTQAGRWDNAFRYGYQSGPIHAAVMYTNGGQDTGIIGRAYGLDAGLTWNALAVEAVYENERGAVNLRSSFDDGANPLPTPGLEAYVSNDTSINIMGKYTLDLDNGGVKDKLTLYAGYTHLQKAHAGYTDGAAQAGYPIDVAININSSAVYNVEWIGARYAMASGLNLVGGLYHINQNSWTIGVGTEGTQELGCSAAGLLCAGNFYEASLVADYVINKHYDAYVGLNYSEVTDGLANGFPGTTVGTAGSESQTTLMVGFRVKF
jgi:predicted porin